MVTLDELATRPFSYAEVGATAHELPDGYRHVHRSSDLGHGDETFRRASECILTWCVQRGAGLEVQASAERVAVGVVSVTGLRLGPLRMRAPCRVVWVVQETDRVGFAYGTLDGHPERGEEAFVVTRARDGAVRFELIAFSRPATLLTRLGGPIGHRIQDRVSDRYVLAVRDAVTG